MLFRSLLLVVLLAFLSPAYSVDLPKAKKCSEQGLDNTQCEYQVRGQVVGKADLQTTIYAMTDMPYALCSEAVCDQDSGYPGKARCSCKVFGTDESAVSWHKASVGPHDYLQAEAFNQDEKLVEVTSNFSLANKNNPKAINPQNCEFDQPVAWANCYGVRCLVKDDGSYADCLCPIVTSRQFTSMGPVNDASCVLPQGKVWSAATIKQGENNMNVMQSMYQKYYPGSPMAKME